MPRISRATIDEIFLKADIVAIIGDYVRLERRGNGDFWGCCPFHGEKTPSFHVLQDQKKYHCFGCGNGGSIVSFIMEIEKLTYPDALEFIAKKSGITVEYEQGYENAAGGNSDRQLKEEILELYKRVAASMHYILLSTPQGAKAAHYLESRHVSSDIIEKFNLGFAPSDRFWLHKFLTEKGYSEQFLQKSGLFSKKNPHSAFFSDRLLFPICDRHGNVVAFGGRILSGDGPKYLNSGEMIQYRKGETLFAFDKAVKEIREQKSVIVCEGYMDVLAYHQAGIINAVAPLGTAFTEEQAKILHSFATSAFLSFDSDGAGQKATMKAILMCRRIGFDVFVIKIDGGKDPAEVLENNGSESLKRIVKCAINDFDFLVYTAQKTYDISSATGKTNACVFIFPYLTVLDSEVRVEYCLQQMAEEFSISQNALFLDYERYKQKGADAVKVVEKKENAQRIFKLTAELRAVLAVAVNPVHFSHMRETITADDFADENAKELFIVLEECFREGVLNYENIIQHCREENLSQLITVSSLNGEYSNNIERTIADGIRLLRKNNVCKKRTAVITKIKELSRTASGNDEQLEELMTEKNSLDRQLFELKDAD